MKFCVCVITRSGAIHAHTLINLMKVHPEVAIEWVDELEQTDHLRQFMSKYDRIVWVGYGIAVDPMSLINPQLGHVIAPSPQRVDWDKFITSTKAGSAVDASQRGLVFDTITDGRNALVSTQARFWAINTKPLLKKMKKKPLPPYERFWSWMQHVAEQKVQVLGSIPVSVVFSHELKA